MWQRYVSVWQNGAKKWIFCLPQAEVFGSIAGDSDGAAPELAAGSEVVASQVGAEAEAAEAAAPQVVAESDVVGPELAAEPDEVENVIENANLEGGSEDDAGSPDEPNDAPSQVGVAWDLTQKSSVDD